MTITLVQGRQVCTVLPNLGGSLGNWTVDDQPMLRTTPSSAIAAADPLGFASFPLVPFSNRIGNAAFPWKSENMSLTKNFPPEPHAIHGIGWQRPWSVNKQASDAVTLQLMHEGDADWPWPFAAEQRITLAENSLTLALSVRNLAAEAVPLAFGHHPYFEQAGATLTFDASRVWMSGADALPTRPVVPTGQYDFSRASRVEGRSIDHCYVGVGSRVRIEWDNRPMALEITRSDTLGAAVVYVPESGNAFCFEPVPHINNALNLPGHEPAMPVVEAGDLFAANIRFVAVLK